LLYLVDIKVSTFFPLACSSGNDFFVSQNQASNSTIDAQQVLKFYIQLKSEKEESFCYLSQVNITSYLFLKIYIIICLTIIQIDISVHTSVTSCERKHFGRQRCKTEEEEQIVSHISEGRQIITFFKWMSHTACSLCFFSYFFSCHVKYCNCWTKSFVYFIVLKGSGYWWLEHQTFSHFF
jgi:hypothetical protein